MSDKKLFPELSIIIFIFLSIPSPAGTVYVPADFNDIQTAIDVSNNGDMIIVADGTYTLDGNRDIDFSGKSVTVRSENGPNDCIIDCNGTQDEHHRGFYFHSGEEANSIVDGFTIKNGYASEGGGIYCQASSPTIKNCKFSKNSADGNDYGGGAICSVDSSPAVTNCTFDENTTYEGCGGGICNYNNHNDIVIADCTFTKNASFGVDGGCGGAIYNWQADGILTVANCTFIENTAISSQGGGGGGMCIVSGSPTVTNCIFRENYSDRLGGGLWYVGDGTDITVTNCTFSSNYSGGGGGMCSFDNSPIIRNCQFSGNMACGKDYYSGGAVLNWGAGGKAIVTNCTLTGNMANDGSKGFGGGISCYMQRSNIMNCILYDNRAPSGNEIASLAVGTTDVNYSDIKNNSVFSGPTHTLNWGLGNIDIDPCFVDPGCWDPNGTPTEESDDFWVSGDYHLLPDSLCINAGDPNYTPEPNETELDGNLRINGGRIDMGAYETLLFTDPVIQPDQWKVEFSAYEGKANPQSKILGIRNGGGGTLNWTITDSCSWLSVSPTSGSSTGEADDAVLSVDISGLSKGTYKCDLTISDPCAINNQQIVTVELVILGPVISLSHSEVDFVYYKGDGSPAIQVLGITNSGGATLHWNITCDCNWLEADPCGGSSSGETDNVELFANGSGLVSGSYDCQLVVSDPNAENNTQTVLVRLLVAAKLHVPFDYGTIQDAINAAQDNDIVIIQHGIYRGNGNRDIDFKGKRIIVQSTNPNCAAAVASTIIDCNGSSVEPHRGFCFNTKEREYSIIDGLTIKNGYAYNGAGIYCENTSPVIRNCQFINCAAHEWGGGVYCYRSSALIDKCVFTGNSAREGGAITARGSFSIYTYIPVISNCHIYDNNAVDSGGGINCDIVTSPIVVNCLIHDNHAGTYGGGGISIFQSNPEIILCTIVNNSSDNQGGGILQWYEHENGSTVSNCILWGNTAGSGQQILLRSEMSVGYCDIEGIGISTLSGAKLHLGKGIFDEYPSFIDPVNDNYHLLPDSPCVNAGDPNYVPEPNETDLDGMPRVNGGRIDMGAYEFNYQPVAIAGPNQTAYAFINGLADVNLNGSGSYDDDGDVLDYYWSWTIDSNVCQANGVSPCITLPVGKHQIELIVDDGWTLSEPNYCTIEVIEPLKTWLWFQPRIFNCNSRPRRIMAMIFLPLDIEPNDVDNQPMIMYPCNTQSKYQRVFRMGYGRGALTVVLAVFDKNEICDCLGIGRHQVEVAGRLQSSRYFYGTSIIKIVEPNPYHWPFPRFYLRY
jgi:predicted outer membrane repeat protein